MRLTDSDASFLYTESASGPMHGGGFYIIEGKLSTETVRDHIAARLHLVPRFRQRLAFVPFNFAHPKWIDDPSFDIKEHVVGHALPEGSDIDTAIDTGMELMEPLLPRDKPLWKLFVISGVEDRTVLLNVGHHAMVDGASGVDISLILFDLQKEAAPPPPPQQPFAPEPLPNPMQLATEAAMEVTQNFASLGRDVLANVRGSRGEMFRRAGETITRFLGEPVLTAPWNRSLVGPKRQFRWRRFSFGEFREIRRVFGGTINDVVLAVVFEAATRYLRDNNVDANGRHLRVMCPVNVRREDEKGALGNRVSAIFPMADAEPMGVVRRLETVRFETEQIKQNREAQALQLLMESAPAVPPVAMAPTLLVGGQFDPTRLSAQFPLPVPPSFVPQLPMIGFNFTCTNVPGVQTPQYMAGHEVLDSMAVLMLGGNLGFGIAILSYNQKLYFNFVCDPRLMPDIDDMAQQVQVTFEELLEAARSSTRQVAV